MGGYEKLSVNENIFDGFDEDEFAIYRCLLTNEFILGCIDERRPLLIFKLQKRLHDYLTKNSKKIVEKEILFIEDYSSTYKLLKKTHKDSQFKNSDEYFGLWVDLYVLIDRFPITFKRFLNYERVCVHNSKVNAVKQNTNLESALLKSNVEVNIAKDEVIEVGELRFKMRNYYLIVEPLMKTSKIEYFDSRRADVCLNTIYDLKAYELKMRGESDLRHRFKHFIIECTFMIKNLNPKNLNPKNKFDKDSHILFWEYFSCNIIKYSIFYRRYLDVKRKQNNESKN